jgi:hypothetical protein
MIAFLVAFLAMEAVSYAMHRWVMHGVGWGWHRSHHEPRRGRRLEENDRFPIVFATLSIVLFATGRWWVAVRGRARDLHPPAGSRSPAAHEVPRLAAIGARRAPP